MNIQQSLNQAVAATVFLAGQSPAYKEHKQLAALGRQQKHAEEVATTLGNRASKLEKEFLALYETYDEDQRAGTAAQIKLLRGKAEEAWNEATEARAQQAYLGRTEQYAEELEQLGFGSSDERLQKARAQAEMAAKTKKKTRRKGGR